MDDSSKVAAYFDLDGTLLNASSEKTLTGVLAKRRPWRIPHATVAWIFGAAIGLLTGKAPYDALRNRGHLSFASWRILEQYSEEIATSMLKSKYLKVLGSGSNGIANRDTVWFSSQQLLLRWRKRWHAFSTWMKCMVVGLKRVQDGYQDLNEDGPCLVEKERCL